MKHIKIWLYVFSLLFLSCERLDFYGDTFYSVKGRITDENDKSVPDLYLRVYTNRENFINDPNDFLNEGIISATTTTDQNGDFLITFPKSNGQNVLLLEDDFKIIDSINSGASNPNMAKLELIKFRNFLLDIKTIKVAKP